MSQQAKALGSATLSRMADTVHEGLAEMRGTTAPRLLLELVCARMLLPATDGSAVATLQRLERLERRMSIAGEHAGRPGDAPADDTAPGTRPPGPAEAPPAPPARPRLRRPAPAAPAAAAAPAPGRRQRRPRAAGERRPGSGVRPAVPAPDGASARRATGGRRSRRERRRLAGDGPARVG